MTLEIVNIVILLAIGSSLCAADDHIVCNEDSEKNLDQIALELSLFGDPKARHPLNAEELSNTCRRDRQNLRWVRSYMSQCMDGIAYDVMALAARDMDSYLKKYCDSPRLNKILLTWSQCGNAAKNETMKCFNEYVLDLERIVAHRTNIPGGDNIPLICCNYFRFDSCAVESFTRPGEAICSAVAIDGLHSMITDVLSASVDFLCGEYKADNDKCDSVNERYKHLKDIAIDKPRKTPVLPFVQIISNYPKLLEAKNEAKTGEQVTERTA